VEAGRQHYNVTLSILTLAGIAYALQQTMVIPALPTLQHDLNTTTTWVTWVLTVFLLVASVATPILGKLGDQYGKERVLLISLLLFLAGSVGAALAWNIWVLIAWRALQGAGAAVFPLSYGIIRTSSRARRSASRSASSPPCSGSAAASGSCCRA
jgi:MFS family permease